MAEMYVAARHPVKRGCTFSVLVGGVPRKVRGETMDELMAKIRALGATSSQVAQALAANHANHANHGGQV